MGCHTWFYRKLDPQPTREEVYLNVEKQIENEIDIAQKIIGRSIDPALLAAYPEWTSEYGERYKKIYERRLRMVKARLCEFAVYGKYELDHLTRFVKDKGFYIEDTGYHDTFRRGGYPDHLLFSLEETLTYISDPFNMTYSVTEYTIPSLTKFWIEYPDGMILFG